MNTHNSHKHPHKHEPKDETGEAAEHTGGAQHEKEDGAKRPVPHIEPVVPPPHQVPQELKDLVEKNIKWSQVIYNQNKKIQRRLTLMVVGSYIRLALVLIPLILALIYLPPFLREAWKQYGDLFQNFDVSSGDISSLFSGK